MIDPEYWSGDAGALDAALALYRSSFERSRIPDERVRALLAEGRYRLALVCGEDGAIHALALVARFPEERFAHLDYLATAETVRRQGHATRLVRWLVDGLKADGLDELTLETDDPLVAFYEARGARRLVGLPYLFPAAKHGPMPMHLMAWTPDGRAEMERARAATIVKALYCGIHGRKDPDPVLGWILARIPASVPLVGEKPGASS